MSNQTQVTTKKDIRSLIQGDQFKLAVQQALPKHLTPDRFIRTALTAMTKTPKLMECDQASFFSALLTLSQLGLEPDGRRAHLIPFGKQVQLIVDYKGLAELAMRSGLISNLHADTVCEKDVFTVDRGEIKEHKINYREPRGNPYAYYAICRFKDGSEKCEVMTKADVDAIRSRSRAGNSGPWATDYNEMAKKTVFRRLSKWLPLSPEERDALEADDNQFEHRTIEDAKPVFGAHAIAIDSAELPMIAEAELSEAEKSRIQERELAEAQ